MRIMTTGTWFDDAELFTDGMNFEVVFRAPSHNAVLENGIHGGRCAPLENSNSLEISQDEDRITSTLVMLAENVYDEHFLGCGNSHIYTVNYKNECHIMFLSKDMTNRFKVVE